MNFELLIPIALFAAIAYSIKAVVDARVRKQLVASNGAPDLVRSILRATKPTAACPRCAGASPWSRWRWASASSRRPAGTTSPPA